MASANKTISLPKSGINVFYREWGSSTATNTILLLHGFPSSSAQYRKLAPFLSTKYRVIAPDLPGFGFTEVPAGAKYTFNLLADTVAEWLDALKITKFTVYVFDYGAPTAFILALQRPQAIEAIITQNGNAYEEGLGGVWAPLQEFWASPNGPEDRQKIKSGFLNYDITKFQYQNGTPDLSTIGPESYTLDYALMKGEGREEALVDLFFDYKNNIPRYPAFQEYFRKSQIKLLAVWGKNDVFFIPPGAEAFKKDLPNAVVKLIDAGHFAAETHPEEIAREILQFLG